MTLLKSLADLPNFSDDEPLIVDVETTSFDDKERAFRPFNGHRVCGVAIADFIGEHTWYMPLRHHSAIEEKNFPFEQGISWLRDTLGTGRTIVNHNIKFDARFLWQDGIKFNGRMLDTMVLARLVNNIQYAGYSLDNLSHLYLGAKKDPSVGAYVKSVKSKDYGVCPIHLMGPYAETDVRLTAQLYHKLLSELPEFSAPIWDIESRFTQWLLRSEVMGVGVDWRRLKQTYRSCLEELVQLGEEINELAGEPMDPGKEKELTRILMGKFGFKPKAYTKTGKPQWNNMALEGLDHPIGKKIARWSSVSHYMSTYCVGWLKRRGDDDRLHGTFNQAGTKFGRMSAKDPNLQNMPPEAEIHIRADEDNGICYFDYSQMEYRIFGHYTRSPAILGAYEKDPYMDFHGHLAGMLGVDRQFAKQMNFSFIYGMGRTALINNIAGLLAIKGADDPNMREKMRTYLTGAGGATKVRSKQLNTSETKALANKIYNDYHKQFPEIRQFQRVVNGAIQRRGYLKNYFGRRLLFPPGSSSHTGVNGIVQGGAADTCKRQITMLHEELVPRYPGMKTLTQVHDSLCVEVPKEQMVDFMVDAAKVLEDTDFRVPMLADGKVADRYLSQAEKIPTRLEIVGEKKYRRDIELAFEQSKKNKIKTWGM